MSQVQYEEISIKPVYSTVILTESAQAHFNNVAPGKYVKFGIIGGGCSGFQYHWETYDEIQDHMEGDEITEYDNFNLAVDGYSVNYLNGTVIDYVSDITGSKIEIGNPNTVGGCGCGESVQF